MTFKSKIDLPFGITMFISIAVLAIAGFFPFFIDEAVDFWSVTILLAATLPAILLLILMTFNTRYTFYNDYLHAKALFFGSKIPYRDIYKVQPTANFISGYRIMTSKDGLEIHSRSIGFGSVKISPQNKDLFIEELKNRAPHVRYEDM